MEGNGEIGTTRRQFLFNAARTAAGVGVLGLGIGIYDKNATTLAATAIRPPGARPEPQFLGACIRCGMCVRDCPYKILDLAKLEQDTANGTPYFVARSGPCEMCGDIPCVKACPTGALDHELTDINQARMGLAVLIDQETCLNFLGLRCDVCYRVCPLIDKAITLERQYDPRGKHALFIPTVHSGQCTGCGKCEHACVLETAAIRVLPLDLVKGKPSAYRRGLEHQNDRDRDTPFLEDLIDLPDRLPEMTK